MERKVCFYLAQIGMDEFFKNHCVKTIESEELFSILQSARTSRKNRNRLCAVNILTA